ncbi:MAG: phosphoglucosamine mutase, partial [Clostridiales bacterium]|nr:phosphoglucosamine mutase [Clostridiales bacterium]
KTVDYAMGRNRYIGYLMTLATRSYKNKRVGLDCANGASSTVAKAVFEALGAKTYVINNEPDGTNINNNCGSTHIEQLQKLVVEKQLDIGFAYDGDADRCLAVDETGEVIDGDKILYACGCYLSERGELNNNTVVTTIMSNLGLYKALDKKGISYEKTAVGDKYVFENMMENGHSLGGEQSGHIIFSKYATTGDGVLTSIKLMEVILEKKVKASELFRDLKIYPQLLQNVRVKSKPEAKADPDVMAAVEKVEKALGEEGRILLRESGTEPVIRVMVEAATDELCKQYVEEVVAVIKAKGHEA